MRASPPVCRREEAFVRGTDAGRWLVVGETGWMALASRCCRTPTRPHRAMDIVPAPAACRTSFPSNPPAHNTFSFLTAHKTGFESASFSARWSAVDHGGLSGSRYELPESPSFLILIYALRYRVN